MESKWERDIRLPEGIGSYTELLINAVRSDPNCLTYDRIRWWNTFRVRSSSYPELPSYRGSEYFTIDSHSLLLNIALEWYYGVDVQLAREGLRHFMRLGETTYYPADKETIDNIYYNIFEVVITRLRRYVYENKERDGYGKPTP